MEESPASQDILQFKETGYLLPIFKESFNAPYPEQIKSDS
jgi:hypothetical protein